jgi:serine/threonine-protein kinase
VVADVDPGWPAEDTRRDLRRQEVEEEPRRTWLYVLLVLFALAAIAALLFFFLRGGEEGQVEQVRMIDVVGVQAADAQTQLAAAGFTDITLVDDPEAEAEAGIVTAQDPPPSDTVTTIPVTTPITLTVATGPGQVAVPSLAGLSQAEARDALVTAGLTFAGTTEEDDPQAARGLVLRSDPEAGVTVEEGADVTLVLASGQNTVPAVIGRPSAEAIQAVQDAGFDVTTQNQESPEPPGTVLAQGGTEDRRLDIGETVTLTVAVPAPPPPSTVTETFTPTPTTTPTGQPSGEPSGGPTD